MRGFLLALAAIATTIPAAEAAQRDTQRTQASRQAKPATQVQATSRQAPSRHVVHARSSSSRVAVRPGDVRTTSSSMVVRGASAATVSRDAMTRQDRGARGWQSGLMPTSHAQTQCPEGTFATLASGHANVVRCMPF
ncbi:hypothetical protein [Falsiroseomonas sp. HW251]|uniref:hypothetical protein n=1 Tax=Falsiroseomonas sp. HW251 TaxID=3390998 RepID=UPI003D321569